MASRDERRRAGAELNALLRGEKDLADVAMPPPVPSSSRAAAAAEDGGRPTRRARALRRQAANRSRRSLGKPPLPEVVRGQCRDCEGWGTIGKAGTRCPACGGEG